MLFFAEKLLCPKLPAPIPEGGVNMAVCLDVNVFKAPSFALAALPTPIDLACFKVGPTP